MKTKKEKGSVLVPFLFFISAMLILAVGSVLAVFRNSYINSYMENRLAACISALERTNSLVESEVLALNRGVDDFFKAYEVTNGIVASGTTSEKDWLVNTARHASYFSQQSDWIANSFLYIYTGGLVIDSKMTKKNWDVFEHKKVFDLWFENRQYQIQNDKPESLPRAFVVGEDIYLFFDFPTTRSLATIALHIDPEKLQYVIKECMGDFIDVLQIRDSNKNYVFLGSGSNNSSWEVYGGQQTGRVRSGKLLSDGNSSRAVSLHSDVTGWNYLCSLKRSQLMPTSMMFILQIVPFVLFLLLLLILLSAMLMKKFYVPLRSVVQQLEEQAEELGAGKTGDGNEYRRIGQIYQYAATKIGKLTGMLTDVSEAVTERILKKMIQEPDDSGNLTAELEQIQSPWAEAGVYIIQCLEFHNSGRTTEETIEQENRFLESIGVVRAFWKGHCQSFVIQLQEQEYAILIRFPPGTPALLIQEKICSFELYWAEKKGVYPFLASGISGRRNSVQDLAEQYSEAINNARHQWYFQQEKSLIFKEDEDLQEEKQRFEYIWDRMQSGRCGIEELDHFLEGLTKQPAPEKQKRIPAYKDLLLEKIIALDAPMLLEEFKKEKADIEAGQKAGMNTDQLWEKMENLFRTAARLLANSMKKEQYRHLTLAKDYIQQNLSNANLSLEDVSSYLGISSSYLSVLFREVLKKGFVDYLNERKIAAARQLLEATEMTVAEIGYKSGFHSPQNFNRVFKKYTGETPGQFRDSHKESAKPTN